MTVRARSNVQQQTKTLAVTAGESEPAILTFQPLHPFDTAKVGIDLQGDLGASNEYLDLYINGMKAGAITTGNHQQVFQHVLDKDISALVQSGQPIVIQFQPTRYVNRLWSYAWKALVTLSLESAPQLSDETFTEFLSPAMACANVMTLSSQSLSASSQNLASGQQQTAMLQHTSNALGIQSIMDIGSATTFAVSSGIIEAELYR
ncbi:hypothetical protein VA7868_00461 [Vibrio aerogenes CECT 7868]|uniref:Uncharacterized protein n=1 Tax=Vibrio aerogenes CECT 7868 TaxID=1216006 RepID=A0A1M5VNK8_9VIBR|nr:RebB family R body protein [Vibrio aerogenes]SHH76800.1 hypothetical protein VA7868_00461 [Vibrio aerogenes CECT 7868]